MGSLFVAAGPNRGALFPFVTDDVVVGRDPETTFQLADARVSRQHFRIAADTSAGSEPRFTLTDLGSANGTTVNGVRVTAPRGLQDGDTIVAGDSTLRFASRQSPAANAAFSEIHPVPKQEEKFKQTLSQTPGGSGPGNARRGGPQ